MFVLADSKTGYVLDCEIDIREKYAEDPGSATIGLTMNMMRRSGYLGQGYYLCTDNYYSSGKLCQRLFDEKTYFFGMVKHY